MARAITAILVVVGLINTLPVVGVLGAERLASLYGVAFADPNVLALMQHRAVLLGLLGGFMIVAAFRPGLQRSAFVLGLISMVVFIAIVTGVDDANTALRNVALVDAVATFLLIVAAVLHAVSRRRQPSA